MSTTSQIPLSFLLENLSRYLAQVPDDARDIAQITLGNNGRLLASGAYLAKRGWTSNDVITRAVRELVAAGFIFQTVLGHRPHKASWYAVTWRALDKLPGFDAGTVEGFSRGAYQKGNPVIGTVPTPPHGAVKNATLTPPHGVEGDAVAPPHGAFKGVFGTSPTPPDGDHLENHLPQQQRKVFKAVRKAVLTPPPTPETDLQHEQDIAAATTTVTADLVQVDNDQNDHANPPRTPPARRTKKEGVRWIQFELMA